MLKGRRNRARIGGAVDRQGDRVAILDVAAHRAGDRDVAAGLGRIEDVVGVMSSSVMVAAPWCRRCRLGRRRRGAVAGRIGGGDARLDGRSGSAARSLPATSMLKTCRRPAGIGRAVHRQGDRVAAPGRRRRPCR